MYVIIIINSSSTHINIWASNNISHIQDGLFFGFHAPPINMKIGTIEGERLFE
jgi:hypothetical protein